MDIVKCIQSTKNGDFLTVKKLKKLKKKIHCLHFQNKRQGRVTVKWQTFIIHSMGFTESRLVCNSWIAFPVLMCNQCLEPLPALGVYSCARFLLSLVAALLAKPGGVQLSWENVGNSKAGAGGWSSGSTAQFWEWCGAAHVLVSFHPEKLQGVSKGWGGKRGRGGRGSGVSIRMEAPDLGETSSLPIHSETTWVFPKLAASSAELLSALCLIFNSLCSVPSAIPYRLQHPPSIDL